MRTQRGLLVALGAVALALAALQGVTGMTHMALYAGPFLLVLGLLLSGRFIGEERILARRTRSVPLRRRARKRQWPSAHRQRLTSQLERSVRSLRGPPLAGLRAAA